MGLQVAKLRSLLYRKRKILSGAFFIVLLLHFVLNSSDKSIGLDVGKLNLETQSSGTKIEINKYMKDEIDDYSVFFKNWEKYKPKSPSLKGKYKKEKAAEKFASDQEFLFSKEYLENVLDIPDSTFKELKQSHELFVNEHIDMLINTYGIRSFSNILPSDSRWERYQGKKGYVMIGGGKYNWLSYLVIKQIRATGSTLPIELFIPSQEEYEKDFCEKVLPQYDAKCIVADRKLMTLLKDRFGISGFQYKLIAILMSQFENVLYLDSDNFPTLNVDYLFESEIYKQTNLIMWPDAWARTTNPKYYDIAGVKVKENKIRYSAYDKKQAENQGLSGVKPLRDYTFADSRFHDFEGTIPDPTSEAGMFLINKTSHLKTLLLCLYYNVFGPDYYYPLLTQGSAGEGDKETFIAAANAIGQPWFQTPKGFKWVGYVSEVDNKFTSKALGHYDPVASVNGEEKVHIIFMHLSYPKYYPDWLANNHDLIYKDLKNQIRMYKDIYTNIGYDFDLRVLQFFTQSLCVDYYEEINDLSIDGKNIDKAKEYMGPYLKYVKEDDQTAEWCQQIFIPHLKWLTETTDYPHIVSNVYYQPRHLTDTLP